MTQPFLYPGNYSPGQFAFNNNPELSQLVTMFAGPLLGQMAGPGNFMPHMMPGQALMDQFTMRNYQNQTRQSTFNVAGHQNEELANRLLGIRSAFTGEKATDMNKEQAMNMAGILNNPMVKTVMGMAMGPENVEALLHGSRGDVQSLNSTINRIGYFRRDPSGGGRMDAESLEDLTTGVFSHLYEPQGDVNKMASRARSGDARSIKDLQAAADMNDAKVVSDTEVSSRLKDAGSDRVGELYKKYVQGGTATSVEEQAKELTRFDRAVKESGVLAEDEASIGQLQTKARRRPTDEMHGFMAGQVSQFAENMFQRGMLPSAIGGMDAKGRVAAISEVKLDDATLDRLARKEAERDILDKKDDFSAEFSRMTEEQKSKTLDGLSGSYKDKIRETHRQAGIAAASGDEKKAQEVLEMTGGKALAGNVDASRTASRIKEYTEAISAVRDIFGDNGNPNAPMPALMAVLDQLTQGGMGSMKPAAVATTLRQMQTLARETGTGMQQIGAISAHAGGLGQQLGLAPSITMQNVANTMGLTKAAMDGGAFGNNVFGTRSKEDFQIRATEMLQRGDASGNAKYMAALNRIYQMDKEKYDGKDGKPATELAAAMAAYNDPNSDGTYKYFDQRLGREVTKNLYQEMGRGRGYAANAILDNSGGSRTELVSNLRDDRTGEFQVAGKGFLSQKHERISNLSQTSTRGAVRNRLRDKNQQYTGALAGMSESQERKLSDKITEMVFDSSNMNLEDQVDYLQKHMKPQLVEHFKSVGHPDPEAAAEQVYEKFGKDRGRLNTLIGNMGQNYQRRYGENMAAGSQMYGQGRDSKGMLESGRAVTRAEATKKMLGYETTMGQRFSDYLGDIGERGEKFNIDQLAGHMTQVIGDRQLAKTFAGEMGVGMNVLARKKDAVSMQREDIEAIATKAKAGDPTAAKKLQEMAGIDDKTLVVKQSDIDAARDAKLAGMSEEALKEEYKKTVGQSGEHLGKDQLIAELKDNSKFNAKAAEEYRVAQTKETGKTKVMTDEEVTNAAIRRNVGKALEGKANEAAYEDISAVQKAIERGSDSDALKTGTAAADRIFAKTLKEHGIKADEMKALVASTGDSAQADILKKFGLTKEEYDKALKQEDPSATKQGRAAEAASTYIAMQAAKKYEADKLGKGAETTPDGKQKVDKANIDATTVVVNADRVEGKGGTAGTATTPDKPAATPAAAPAATAAAAAGAEATQKPTGDVSAINDEMNKILGRMKSPTLWGRMTGNKDEFASPEDEKRYRELSAQKQAAIEQQREQKTTPTDTAEPKKDTPLATADSTAAPAEPPAAAKAAEDAKDVKIEQQVAETAAPAATPSATVVDETKLKQKADEQADKVAAADKPLDPVATTENKEAADELQRKTDQAAVASAIGPAAAKEIVPDKAPIDAASLTAVKDGEAIALPGSRVKDKDGKKTILESETGRWDAMYTRDVSEDKKSELSGRVAMLGDKHYEEYFDSMDQSAWREVSVEGADEHPPARQRDGLDALMDVNSDGLSAMLDSIPKDLHAAAKKREKPVKTSGQNIIDATLSTLTGVLQPDREAVLAEGEAARNEARQERLNKPEAAVIPPEKTSTISGGATAATYASANVSPAVAAAATSPQQAAAAGAASAKAMAGGDGGSITINGRLSLDGLQEAIMDATGQKAVSTPNNGVPVVGDPPMNRVSGGSSSAANR